jgi:CRP-like cAMP-binding protein
MLVQLAERLAPVAANTPRPVWATGPAHPGLRGDENAALQGGQWFAGLSAPLRHSILGRAVVRHVAAGDTLARRGDTHTGWVGVVRGAVRLGASLTDGREFTLDFVAPGQWFGDIALIDDHASDLDMVAHVPSTLLIVSKADLRRLLDSHDELRDAFLQLNCTRLRHVYRRFEELHALTLAQRLARQIQRLAHRFGRPTAAGLSIDLPVSQGDLAAMVGGSRQRVNCAWREMRQLGIVELARSRLVVRDEAQLAAAADGHIVLSRSRAAARCASASM